MVKKSKTVPNVYKEAFESVVLRGQSWQLDVLKARLVMKMLLLN